MLLPGFLRIPFFPVFSGGIFHRNVVLERSQEFLFFPLSDCFCRNSCGTGIPVFNPEWIPEGSCSRQKLLWPATKEGSLLSKIWTKTYLFNLSPEQDLTMVSASPVLCWRLLPPGLKVRACPRCLLGAQRSLVGMNVLGRNYET